MVEDQCRVVGKRSAVKRAKIKQGKRLQAQAKSPRDSGIGAKAQVQTQAKSARDSGIGPKAQVAVRQQGVFELV